MQEIPETIKIVIQLFLKEGAGKHEAAAYAAMLDEEGTTDEFLNRIRKYKAPYSLAFLTNHLAEVHRERWEPFFEKAHRQYLETGDAGICFQCNRGKLTVTEQKTNYGIAYIYDCDTCGYSRCHGVKTDSEESN